MKRHRVIWAFALGYFAFYTPYAALSKAVTAGLLRGIPPGLSGFEILPAVILGTVVSFLLILTLLGWWKYAAIPSRTLVVSGVGTALLIAATTIAYTFKGISIVLALLLMRGGLLIIGPLTDAVFGRRVRWFSWGALIVSFGALAVSFANINDGSLPLLAGINLAVYLTGYSLRTPCMTKAAKVRDADVTKRYFVQEALVTAAVLPLLPLTLSLFGNPVSLALRRGITTFWSMHTAAILPSVVIGVLYAGLYVFGTLIYLDARENTFCVPLFCGASFLAGFTAVYGLLRIFGFPSPPGAQLVSAAMILAAMALLSPFHHVLEDAWAFVTGNQLRGTTVGGTLFVCSGASCRAPLTAALRQLTNGEPAREPRPVHGRAVANAELIYCMTEEQRAALVDRYPEAAAKTRCVEPAVGALAGLEA
jgi:hypothetical protein